MARMPPINSVPLPRASSVQALLSRVSLDGTADVARSRSTSEGCCSVVVAHSSPSFLPLNPPSLPWQGPPPLLLSALCFTRDTLLDILLGEGT